MTVKVNIANRTELMTNLYWSPSSEPDVVSYNIYTSLLKDTGYILRTRGIPNRPDPSGTVPINITGFIKPGSISYNLRQATFGILDYQEYFIKVTTTNSVGFEDSLNAVSYYIVRTESNNAVGQNINTDNEKGVLIWEENGNHFRRPNAHAISDSAEAAFAMDVHLVDSKSTITNSEDALGNLIPLTIQGSLNPNYTDLERTIVQVQTASAEITHLEGSPISGEDFQVHSISMSSDIALNGTIIVKSRLNGSVDFTLDSRELIALEGDDSYYFSPENPIILKSTDMLYIESTGFNGQVATINLVVFKSTLNKG